MDCVDHDNNGRFKKGNKAATSENRSKHLTEMKSALKSEVYKCAASLLKEIGTLKVETKDGTISRYQYIINRAIMSGNFKVIAWLTEMIIGKPKQSIENTGNERPCAFIERADGSIVKLGWEDKNEPVSPVQD